jgi:hypothetical protein
MRARLLALASLIWGATTILSAVAYFLEQLAERAAASREG